MLEHLHQEDAMRFLREAHRVLRSGGIIRVAVPNIRYHVDNYLRDGDADLFMEKTLLTRSKPRTLIGRLKYLIAGDRNHQWMYDGESLCRLLSSAGFQEPQVMEPGSTMIADPGKLDLEEGMPESVFAEAVKP